MVSAAALNPSSVSHHAIVPLTGKNFKKWKEDVDIVLGIMDMDLALREDEPARPADGANATQRLKYEKWQKANRVALMIIKRSMTDAVRGGVPDLKDAKAYLVAVEERFQRYEKAETGVLMCELTTMRYDGAGSVREYILKLIDISSKLKELEVSLSDAFLVHTTLNSLPAEFTTLKSSYNAQREKWNLNELIAICVQEEDRIRREKVDLTVNMITKINPPKSYPNESAKKELVKNVHLPKKTNDFKANKTSNFKCFFCKRPGHMKKACHKYKRWLEKQEVKGLSKKENSK